MGPDETPEEPAETPEEGPEEPAETPEEGPEEPAETPEEGPEEPAETPEEGPEEPAEMPEEGPEEPVETPEGPVEGPEDCPSIVEVAAQIPALSDLLQLVEAADLVEALSKGDEGLTLFAPTNEAIEALSEDVLEALAADQDALIRVRVRCRNSACPAELRHHNADVEALFNRCSSNCGSVMCQWLKFCTRMQTTLLCVWCMWLTSRVLGAHLRIKCKIHVGRL